MTRSAKKRRPKLLKHADMTQSTRLVGCHKDAAEIHGAVASLTESGAASLERRLEAVLAEGEEMPDVRLLFCLMGRLVDRDLEALDEAEEERWSAGAGLLAARDRCRAAKAELYAATVRVRDVLVSLFGSAYSRFRFGLGARTARGAADLVLEAGKIARGLRSARVALPEPSTPGLHIDPKAWAKTLRPRAARLERLLKLVEVYKNRAADRVAERNRRLESFRRTYVQVARSLETLLVLAGEEQLANSVRSSARWRARVAEARRERRARVVRTVRASLGAPRRAIGRIRSTVVSIGEWLAAAGDPRKPREPGPAERALAAENR